MDQNFKVIQPKDIKESINFLYKYNLEEYAKTNIEIISVFTNKIRNQELVTIKYGCNGKTRDGIYYTKNIWTKGRCDGY